MKATVAGVVALLVLLPLMVAALSASQNQGTPVSINTAVVPPQYVSLVERAGQTCPEYPAALLAAQIQQESGWNPAAMSPVGAQGIAQFMPNTWASLGLTSSPLDPSAAIPAMATLMCGLFRQVESLMGDGAISHGTPTQNALAAYNAGLGAVLRAGGFPTGIGETDRYVPAILALQVTFGIPGSSLSGPTVKDLGSSGPCPLGASNTGVSCNVAIAYAVAQMDAHQPVWHNLCLTLVTLAYGGEFAGIGDLTALAAAQAVQSAGLMQPATTDYAAIPRGAVVWFDDGGAGHVALSVGGGYAISTDVPADNGYIGIEPISFFEATWHQRFIGWSPPRV